MDVEESPWADSNQAAQAASSQQDPKSPQASTGPAATTTAASSSRPSRGPRRLVAQPTRLEAVEDPLGPLSASTADENGGNESPPVPPQKEQMVIRTTMSPHQQQHQQPRRPLDPHQIDDNLSDVASPGGPRAPPPVEAGIPTGVKSNVAPSVSIEQAAKPTFHISVGDPVKIGDLTSSHIVYSVRTQVS